MKKDDGKTKTINPAVNHVQQDNIIIKTEDLLLLLVKHVHQVTVIIVGGNSLFLIVSILLFAKEYKKDKKKRTTVVNADVGNQVDSTSIVPIRGGNYGNGADTEVLIDEIHDEFHLHEESLKTKTGVIAPLASAPQQPTLIVLCKQVIK